MSYAEWDVDAHAYDEVRYEEHRARWTDNTDSGASASPPEYDEDSTPSDAPEDTQEAA